MNTLVQPPIKKSSRLWKYGKITAGLMGVVGISGGIYYSTLDQTEKRKARVAVGGIRRFAR